MAKFNLHDYNTFSGCDIVVTARMSPINGQSVHEKVYTLGSLQTLSISTHQDKRPVRAIGNINAIDYTMGQRTVAGSLVFAVFDRHFAAAMVADLQKVSSAKGATILPDELPPLDLTISFANEYGKMARMALFGVRLIDEGQVMSVNDVYTENTYQYVATSLEPLNEVASRLVGVSNKRKGNPQVADAPSNSSKSSTNGKNIANASVKSHTFEDDKVVELSVNVEHAINSMSKGIARFSLKPNKTSGFIKITNLSNNSKLEVNIVKQANPNVLYKELSIGQYSAVYQSVVNNEESNVVTFAISNTERLSQDKDDKPIIEMVNDTTLYVTTNNTAHTHISYSKSGATSYNVNTIELNLNKVVIDGLDPNTEYTVFSHVLTDDKIEASSKQAIVTTLKTEEEYVTTFIDYINNNKNMLSNPIEDYEDILKELPRKNKSETIIDLLLKGERDILVSELLLYAMKYQNEMNALFNNHSSFMPKKNIKNPFYNSIIHNEGSEKSIYTKTEYKKNYFLYPITNTIENDFIGKSYTRFSTYDIAKDKSRGPRYDFVYIPDTDRSELHNYKKVDIVSNTFEDEETNIALSNYDTAIKVAATKNKLPNISILPAPIATYDGGTLTVDINYKDTINYNDIYYLCISETYESMDHTSFRKIPFKGSDETIIETSYRTGIINGKSYLLWIENENNIIISDSSIIDTKEDVIYDEIIKEKMNILIDDIKRYIWKEQGHNILYDSIFAYFESSVTYEKTIYMELALEMIKQIEYQTDIMEMILLIYKKKHSLIEPKVLCDNIKYNKKTRSISVTSNKLCKVSIHEYSALRSEYRVSQVHRSDDIILSNDVNYTVMYLTDLNMINKQGVIVINNLSGEIKSYGIEVEVIE